MKMMIRAAFAALTLLMTTVASADLLVIVNAENADKIDVKFVKSLYLGKETRFPSGEKATPLMQTEDNELTELFLKEIVRQKPVQFKRLWSKALFTGEGTPPEEFSSDAEIIRQVINNTSAIGYIDSNNFTNEVRAILRIKTQ
jgi:ABC-type phosphate transport system substrate-binding protein